MGTFLASIGGLERVDILPYHVIGVGKYARLERDYTLSEVIPPAAVETNRIGGILREYGLTVTVRGESDVTE